MVARGEPMSDVFLQRSKDEVFRWVKQLVIGENLCPFAHQTSDATRYAPTPACTLEALLECLQTELNLMLNSNPSELAATLIITPMFLDRFEDYLEALALIEHAIEHAGLDGVFKSPHFIPITASMASNQPTRPTTPIASMARFSYSARRASRMGDCQPPRHRSGASKKCSAFQTPGGDGHQIFIGCPARGRLSVRPWQSHSA